MSTNDAVNLLKDAITDQLLIHECTEIVAKRTENPGGTETISFSAVGPDNAGPFGFAFVCANSHPFPAATTAAYIGEIIRAFIRHNRRFEPNFLFAKKLIDSGKLDDKIIAVPFSDPTYLGVKSMDELPPHVLAEIRHFFTVYKRLENKQTAVREMFSREEAVEIIRTCIRQYSEAFSEKTEAHQL